MPVKCHSDDTPLTFHNTRILSLIILLVHISKFNMWWLLSEFMGMQGFYLRRSGLLPRSDAAARTTTGVIYVVRFYELLGDLCVFSASRTLAPTFMNRVTCVSFIWLPAAYLLRITSSLLPYRHSADYHCFLHLITVTLRLIHWSNLCCL